jgi:DNA repair protein RecN (Recombination protein N)
MLAHLTISNYAIVDHLEMEFGPGMTVVTGETGAGKSIMLDALGLCLGDRADPNTISAGADRADITATFDIARLEPAQRWLGDRELDAGDDCLLRRTLNREGRSRAFINGHPCTLQDCAQLGALLIDIHSQHAHQSLLRRETQRQQLDEYAGQTKAAKQLEQIASDWLRLQRQLEELAGSGDERNARAQLLAYQVEELDALNPQAGDVEALATQQKQLANAEQILHSAQQTIELCEQQEDGARRALQLVHEDIFTGDAINTVRELLDSASIQLGEARAEMQHFVDQVEVNPENLRAVESKLDTLYEVARKHRVRAEELPDTHQQLAQELAELRAGDANIEGLQAQLAEMAIGYSEAAVKLGKARAKAAKKLTRVVEQQLAELAMQQCQFEIALSPRESNNPHPHGLEDVEFRISTNPGQTPAPLGKIASGGELSRISLAIQVVTASTSTVPAMVFDEVDVGIGGAVAEVVGRLLRNLSDRAQVMCVTHLPQVASLGHQHLQVSKISDKKRNLTQLAQLDEEERVEEIARMLGGIELTEQTRAHAREMLAISS